MSQQSTTAWVGMTAPIPATDVAYTWSDVRVYVTAAANGTALSAHLSVTQNGCTATYAVRGLYPAVSCAVPPPQPEPPMMSSDDAGATPDADDAGASPGSDDAGATADADDAGATADADDAGTAPDADDAGSSDPPPPAPMLDETLCSPFADIAKGRPLGSGINPDVATRCDTALQMCVLAKDAPSFR